jgi:pimeloyl-ACP methyl ester carboxylesterase
MNKLTKLILLFILSSILLVFFGIVYLFSGMILHPFWLSFGVGRECNSLLLESSPEVCIDNPESAIKYKFESFSVDSKQGKIDGWYFPSSKGNDSAVVFAHGAGGDRREGYKYISFLTDAGYALYIYDAPNHGRSTNDGNGVSYGVREKEGFISVLNLASSKYKNIFVITNSAGSGAVALSLDFWKDKVKAMVVENPPYSLHRLIKENPTAKMMPTWLVDFILWFTNIRGKFDTASIITGEIAKDYPDIPYFVTHGTDDTTVPYRHGVDFFISLRSSNKIFFEAKGAEHGRVWNNYTKEFETNTLETFKKAKL